MLITTRDRAWLKNASAPECQVEVMEMTARSALQLLGADDDAARSLAARLAYLPLALSHAKAVKGGDNQTYAAVLRDLVKVDLTIASGDNFSELEILRSYPKEVVAIFDASIKAIQLSFRDCPEAHVHEAPYKLAVACGYLDAEHIPLRLLQAILTTMCGVQHEAVVDDILKAMVRFSMLARRADGTFDMHRVLQVAMRVKDGKKVVLREVVELMASTFGFDETKTQHPDTSALAPHVDAVLQAAQSVPAVRSLPCVEKCLLVESEWYDFFGLFRQVGVSTCIASRSL